jgi:alpha-1,2-mannosyltransferase
VFAGALIATVVTVARNATGTDYGFDYRGIWDAARHILDGHNPYPAADPRKLLLTGNAYVLPPLLGLATTAFARLPFTLAIALCNVICVVAFLAALRIAGVRDWRVYTIAALSFPFVSSIVLGQPEGLFALALALIWRYRESWPAAILVALLIATKWLAWPLVLWFLLERRYRLAGLAVAAAAVLVVASWAVIGFDGFTNYLSLTVANSHAAVRTDSLVALVLRVGGPAQLGDALALLCAAGLVGWAFRYPHRDELTVYSVAVAAGLILSPIVWSHYLVMLFIPLAIRRPSYGPVWLALAAFWLSPVEPPPSVAQLLVVILAAAWVVLAAARVPRGDESVGRGAYAASDAPLHLRSRVFGLWLRNPAVGRSVRGLR